MQNKYLLSCVEISKIFVNINLLKCNVWITPMAYIAPFFVYKPDTPHDNSIPNARSVSFEILYQGRSQTSEQDEASFERQRREPLTGGLGACRPRKFWNLEVQKCSFTHFPWHFSSEKSISQLLRLASCRPIYIIHSVDKTKLFSK